MTISRSLYRRRLTACKYAVIVSYNGSGYSGLQWQSDLRIPTIEAVIWDAFYAADLIRKSSTRNNCHALQFSRASRTDRGVSALGQVLSCVLNKYSPEKLPLINAHLPDHIRVHDVIGTVQSFDAWDWANHRHYSYIVPTYVFADVTDHLQRAHSYRITETHLAYVRKVLSQFLGSRNYVNFTDPDHIRKYYKGRKEFLSACHRVIFGASLEDPFIYRGVEFCVINFKGEAFLYHQVRKMVSCLFLRVRGVLTADDLDNLFDYHTRLSVELPLAPPRFLFLRNTGFDFYNKFHYPFNPHVFPRLCPQELDFSHFYEFFIKRPMLDLELDDNVFATFVSEMDSYSFAVEKDKSRIPPAKKNLWENYVDEISDFDRWLEELEVDAPRSVST